jgi:phosphatidylglycerol---prolipoprotein diacylglyceryl transferase
MHPVLIRFGDISIYTYGFFIAVGFVVGILLAKKEAARVGIDPDLIMDLSFYIIISAIVGSRLFYVLTMPETYLKKPLEIFKIWNGGLVFYGGFILALITAIFFIVKRKAPLWKTADIFAPSVAIGQFFGRLGCFSAGCCYGKICDLPWAVTFRHPESLAPIGIPLHPSQLYHALGNFLIFAILQKMKNKKKFHGQLFWTYVALDGGIRCFLEIFRGDFRGQIFLNLFSLSQVIGALMILIGIAMLTALKRQNA